MNTLYNHPTLSHKNQGMQISGEVITRILKVDLRSDQMIKDFFSKLKKKTHGFSTEKKKKKTEKRRCFVACSQEENFLMQLFNKHYQKSKKQSCRGWWLHPGKHSCIPEHCEKPVSYKELMTTLNKAEVMYQPAQGDFPYSHSCC